QKA
ncbi:hypothetical protein D046_7215B, partial [Vibrio parahaemolyticus V-223/04]